MAKLPGGIFSRPSGKTGNIVFGAARTRAGKVATAREFVSPSNPNTTAQQTQRNKFSESLAIVRKVGKNIYGSDWNRSISQLPGFQSMMSIFMLNMDDNFILTAPVDVNLGTLFPLENFSSTTGTIASQIDVAWGTSAGTNGTPEDSAILILVQATPAATAKDREVITSDEFIRLDEGESFGVSNPSTDYLVMHYVRGAGAAAGLLSIASSEVTQSSA